ncbi:hypothetical protein QTO34_014124 [Cnephaeus nilssonii]|uniref:Fibronectin type-III domain-containing protein n=1 Tax=Cnephaeus nilssonii TaxID=3371016 RepID=A0AA40IA40_CNENI|nr:hypothetical protein QTO34_014124 [Eptesicus nilssonii]
MSALPGLCNQLPVATARQGHQARPLTGSQSRDVRSGLHGSPGRLCRLTRWLCEARVPAGSVLTARGRVWRALRVLGLLFSLSASHTATEHSPRTMPALRTRTWTLPALLLLLTAACLGELLDPCGHIDPESPVVRLGSNFTAVCVLQEKCMDYFHVNADYIFWKTNHETVPRTQYAVINRTASSVTFADVALLNTQLTCNIRTFGQIDQNVYGVRVVSGLPPEKPTNLSCIVNEGKRMTCQWDPGRETHLETNFTLKSEWQVIDVRRVLSVLSWAGAGILLCPVRTFNASFKTFYLTFNVGTSETATEKFPDCKTKRGSPTACTVEYPTVYFVNMEVWVEARNALGEATSEHINFDPVDKVKPIPPRNVSVSSSEELSSILKLTWVNSGINKFIGLKYDIQYRARAPRPGASLLTLPTPTAFGLDLVLPRAGVHSLGCPIPLEDTASTRYSFTVQDLRPFTEYVFRLRCMKEDGQGFWSDWSEEARGTTYEDRPSRAPSFWYKAEPSPAHGSRSVQLMWKGTRSNNEGSVTDPAGTRSNMKCLLQTLPPFEANGKILDYEVTLTRWKSHSQNYTVRDTKLTVNLTSDRYTATLTARNLVGTSDAAVLTIPACDFPATRPVRDLKAFPKDNRLWVEWSAPREPVSKYILEWCVLSDKAPCVPDWQQEDGHVHRTPLTGRLAESTCYLITVTPVYSDGPGAAEAVRAYLKQAPPSKGPTVRTKKVGKNEAVLEWDQLPVDVQNGFIRNYTIFYKTSAGNETAVNVDSSHTEYTLSSLTSDTLYMVRMAAYTDEGGKDGPEFTFTTPKFAQGEIEAIVVPVCLAFLLLTLLGVLLCFNKRDLSTSSPKRPSCVGGPALTPAQPALLCGLARLVRRRSPGVLRAARGCDSRFLLAAEQSPGRGPSESGRAVTEARGFFDRGSRERRSLLGSRVLASRVTVYLSEEGRRVVWQHNFNAKDQVFSDGALTDLSVVEIEASDKKPLPEELKALDLFRKEKLSTGGHSSGIGGSSCMSSRQSLSSGDEAEAASAQSAASAVQYSTVVHSGYRHQVPSVQVFSRSESTQPLLDCEERPDELPPPGDGSDPPPRQPLRARRRGRGSRNHVLWAGGLETGRPAGPVGSPCPGIAVIGQPRACGPGEAVGCCGPGASRCGEPGHRGDMLRDRHR